jgi:hypothetical protein
MTNRERVLGFLRSIAPNGATNEEIVSKTGVRPHQTVFQITRQLRTDGVIKGVQAGKEWRFWCIASSVLGQRLDSPQRELQGTSLSESLPGRDEDHGKAVTFRDPESIVIEERSGKPSLTTDVLLKGGFTLAARWKLLPDGRPQLDAALPKDVGVYAFASAGAVLYVGVATMGLKKRIYFYGNPGRTQRTSLRIHELIKSALSAGQDIQVLIAIPADSAWNGLPIHGSAGLELGLIRKYSLSWNKRSAG